MWVRLMLVVIGAVYALLMGVEASATVMSGVRVSVEVFSSDGFLGGIALVVGIFLVLVLVVLWIAMGVW